MFCLFLFLESSGFRYFFRTFWVCFDLHLSLTTLLWTTQNVTASDPMSSFWKYFWKFGQTQFFCYIHLLVRKKSMKAFFEADFGTSEPSCCCGCLLQTQNNNRRENNFLSHFEQSSNKTPDIPFCCHLCFFCTNNGKRAKKGDLYTDVIGC